MDMCFLFSYPRHRSKYVYHRKDMSMDEGSHMDACVKGAGEEEGGVEGRGTWAQIVFA